LAAHPVWRGHLRMRSCGKLYSNLLPDVIPQVIRVGQNWGRVGLIEESQAFMQKPRSTFCVLAY